MDEDAYRLAYEYTARGLSADLGVDALLLPSVYRRPVDTGWNRGTLYAAGEPVSWDGEPLRRGAMADPNSLEPWPQ